MIQIENLYPAKPIVDAPKLQEDAPDSNPAGGHKKQSHLDSR